METLRDSIETAVALELFPSIETSSEAHARAVSVSLPMSLFRKQGVENFNSDRLSADPYPPHDRPRGRRDLTSVAHHRAMVREKGETLPIWVAKRGRRYILLDGAHRLVATHLEGKSRIPAFVVTF